MRLLYPAGNPACGLRTDDHAAYVSIFTAIINCMSENGSAATVALAESLGAVVREAVAEAIRPLESRMDSLESEVREIHELVQIPESQARERLTP